VLNFVPPFAFIYFLIADWSNDCTKPLHIWLLVAFVLFVINCHFAIYLYNRLSNYTEVDFPGYDPRASYEKNQLNRALHFFLYDPGVCLYIILAIFIIAWGIIGLIWTGGTCSSKYDDLKNCVVAGSLILLIFMGTGVLVVFFYIMSAYCTICMQEDDWGVFKVLCCCFYFPLACLFGGPQQQQRSQRPVRRNDPPPQQRPPLANKSYQPVGGNRAPANNTRYQDPVRGGGGSDGSRGMASATYASAYAPPVQPQYASPQPQYAPPQPQYAPPQPQYAPPQPQYASPQPQAYAQPQQYDQPAPVVVVQPTPIPSYQSGPSAPPAAVGSPPPYTASGFGAPAAQPIVAQPYVPANEGQPAQQQQPGLVSNMKSKANQATKQISDWWSKD